MRLVKGLFLLLVFLTASSVFAREGDFMMGMQFGSNNLTTDLKDGYNMGLNAGIGAEYFKSDKFALTFALDYNSFPGKDNSANLYDYKILAGAFTFGCKYYFLNMNKGISPYLGIGIGYHVVVEDYSLKSPSSYPNDNSRVTSTTGMVGILPRVGVSYPLSKRFFVNFDMSYTFTWVNQDNNPYGYGNMYNEPSTTSNITNYAFWRASLGFMYNFE